jgi:urea transporter
MNIHFACFAKRFLHRFGQVMLQENAITGLLFLLGIGLSSPTMLLGGIMATISALVLAKVFKYNLWVAQSGLYGFNAALVGIGAFYFLPVSTASLIFVIIGGAFSSLLMHVMIIRLASIPALTTPFILTTWLMLILIDYMGLSTLTPSDFYPPNSPVALEYFFATFRGLAQVMLQDSWLCGAIFLCALAVNSTKIAGWALTGSAVGMLIAAALSFSQEMLVMGMYGFNSCLVAITLSARYPKKYWLIILGCVVSVLLTSAFEQVSLPALTAPFVMTTWLMIGLVNIKHKANEVSRNKTSTL